ncbi:DUF7878 domain-containing protein [Streptomyces sp. NPDC054784]
MQIEFSRLRTDPEEVSGDALSSVVGQASNVFADLEIRGENSILYTDDAFPVVELAHHLHEWLHGAMCAGRDFVFDSMFFEEPGEMAIRSSNERWTVTVAGGRVRIGEYTDAEMARAICDFIEALAERFVSRFHADLAVTCRTGSCAGWRA